MHVALVNIRREACSRLDIASNDRMSPDPTVPIHTLKTRVLGTVNSGMDIAFQSVGAGSGANLVVTT